MIEGTGKTIRMGDWVRLNDGYHSGAYAQVAMLGPRAAHVHVWFMSQKGVKVYLTLRATKVIKVTIDEVMLYKLENS